MIAIKVNGEFLDLFPDTEINLKLNNPIFAEGKVIPGSFSIPFDIPFGDASPNNTRILSHHDQPNNPATSKKVAASIYFDGNLYRQGILELGGTDGTSLSVNFILGLRAFADSIKETKVNEIITEEVTLATSTYQKRILFRARTDQEPGPFKIEVNGEEYEGTTNQALADAIAIDQTVKTTYYSSGYPGNTALDYIKIEPYFDGDDIQTPLTIRISSEAGKYNGEYDWWSLNSEDFEAEYNGSIITALNQYLSATPPDDMIRFPTVKNDKLYDDKLKYYHDRFHYPFQNVASLGSYILNTPSSDYYGTHPLFEPDNRTSISPFVRLVWLLEKISEHIGLDYEGDFITDADIQNALLYHSNTLDMRIPFLGDKDWIACRRSFAVSEFVPDITIANLFKELQTRFNLAVYYNETNGHIRIKFRDPILRQSEYTDITHMAGPAENTEDVSATGVRLEAEAGDDEGSIDYYEEGEVEQTINTKVSAMNGQVEEAAFRSPNRDMPFASAEHSDKIPVRIMFYSGIKQDSGGHNYASAEKDATAFAFSFDGETGMKETLWRSWYRFLMNRRERTHSIKFDFRTLQALDWEHKYMIAGIKHLIKSVDVTLTMRGIKAAKVQLYTT